MGFTLGYNKVIALWDQGRVWGERVFFVVVVVWYFLPSWLSVSFFVVVFPLSW